MKIDFANEESPVTYQTEVCIIGSGAAGVTLALALARKGMEVLLVESGGFEFSEETQNLYRSEVVGRGHAGIHTGRYRTYGGTTTRWGGQALELRKIDFEARSWIPLSGWPVGYHEIASYYSDAYGMLSLKKAKTDAEIWNAYHYLPPRFDDDCVQSFLTRWSPRPNFVATFGSDLIAHSKIRVLLHANVTEIIPVKKGTEITHLRIATLRGRTGIVRAQRYVLCCGAIENARLLLLSRSVRTQGVGNDRDWVGRCFQDHLTGPIAEVITDQREAFTEWAGLFYHRRLKYFSKFELSAEIQRKENLLNIAGNFFFEDERFSDPASASKRILREMKFGRSRELGAADFAAAFRECYIARRSIYAYLIRGRNYSPVTGRLLLEAHCEQPPLRENRVELSQEVDALKLPRSKLIWNASEQERHTICTFARILSRQLESYGLGRLRSLIELDKADQPWGRHLHDNNHHIGTTRMAVDASLGVVDTDCRVFGFSNLYICSSSVFPTSGHSNPTLTIIALAYRLADKLGHKRG